MANLTYPLMRSLPQVVFTAAFLKYPTPAVVCSRILSAALELCSSVLPSNLVKRELDFSIALSLDLLNKLARDQIARFEIKFRVIVTFINYKIMHLQTRNGQGSIIECLES